MPLAQSRHTVGDQQSQVLAYVLRYDTLTLWCFFPGPRVSFHSPGPAGTPGGSRAKTGALRHWQTPSAPQEGPTKFKCNTSDHTALGLGPCFISIPTTFINIHWSYGFICQHVLSTVTQRYSKHFSIRMYLILWIEYYYYLISLIINSPPFPQIRKWIQVGSWEEVTELGFEPRQSESQGLSPNHHAVLGDCVYTACALNQAAHRSNGL